MPAESTIEHPDRELKEAPASTELEVTGMTCSNCARHVTEAIRSVPAVQSAQVNLDGSAALVRWKPGSVEEVAAVIEAVEKAGYGAKVLDAHAQADGEHHLQGWQTTLWIGIAGMVPLMLGEWVFRLGLTPWFRWFSFGLASMTQIFAGARFYRGAWHQLRVGSSNMDTLVALGSSTAFGYSAWALFKGLPGHLYFMEAAAIVTLISAGHWMESRVSARASSALRKLLNLAPALARRHNPDGSETEMPVGELRIGDLFSLRPGDRVPIDGEVVAGASTVDESMLTGESNPVDKAPGKLLYAGTVNLNGQLTARVSATGERTALAQIIAAVERAQSSRANIQRLGDKVSNVFVPVVILVALGAGLWWGLAPESAQQAHAWFAQFLWWSAHPAGSAAGFIIAAAVLIIACPCAMGLATPAAIMAGSNAAAERGILIRDGVALEKAGQIRAVIFDKTGTLTFGKPSLVAVWDHRAGALPLTDLARSSDATRSVLDLAASLARHSTHPISQTLANISAEQKPLKDWQEFRGAGVEGKTQSLGSGAGDPTTELARLGSLKWLRDCAVEIEPGKAFVEEWSAQGATVTGLALGRVLLGLFAVKDTLKPGAREVVAQLRGQGLEIYLITGDSAATAASIARQAGIEQVFAEVRPEEKAKHVKRLQEQGTRVAFIGDGINDAPALEQSDLGIAVSRASDIAREAADIILLNSEIEAVPESLGLARATLRTIKQNLFWAFFYNAAGIPLAALGFMSPVLCALAMGLSDLVVIGNALRLRRWRLK